MHGWRLMKEKYINVGDVIRWFCIDWEFLGMDFNITENDDKLLETLGSMRGVVEVNSGHTGINVGFENIRRTNDEVIFQIKQRLNRFRNNKS